MNSKLFQMVICVSLILSFGCSDGSGKSNKGKSVRRPTVTKRPVVKNKLHDPECQELSAAVEINTSAVWGWDNFSIVDQMKGFSGTGSNEFSLHSESVIETRRESHFVRICDGQTPMGQECRRDNGDPMGYLMPQQYVGMRLCNDDYAYPRDSKEGVGITATSYIHTAAAAYQSATGKKLKPVKLEVFPLFESQILKVKQEDGKEVNVRQYLADNAAYYPGHDMVVIFPQSQGFALAGMDRFWESEFVLAHEMGHHVEQETVGPYLKKLGLAWNPERHEFKSLRKGADEHPLTREFALLWTSVSEAFADLSAFYALRGDDSTLTPVNCLGENRSVLQGRFDDSRKTPKHLTENVVSQLLGKEQDALCEYKKTKMNFSDPHNVGAVLGYALDQVLRVVAPSDESTSGLTKKVAEQRYRLLLDWIEAFILSHLQQIDRPMTTDYLFSPLTASIESALSKSNLTEEQKAMICDLSKDILPILEKAPFADSCGA